MEDTRQPARQPRQEKIVCTGLVETNGTYNYATLTLSPSPKSVAHEPCRLDLALDMLYLAQAVQARAPVWEPRISNNEENESR